MNWNLFFLKISEGDPIARSNRSYSLSDQEGMLL